MATEIITALIGLGSIPLIPNAFYFYQNNKYIYIRAAKIADDWEQNLFV